MIQSLSFYILFIYVYNINNTSPSPSLSLRCKACIVLRLGGLLALGFGEAGAEVIGQNMKAGQKSRHDDTTRHDWNEMGLFQTGETQDTPRYPKISQDIPRSNGKNIIIFPLTAIWRSILTLSTDLTHFEFQSQRDPMIPMDFHGLQAEETQQTYPLVI